MLYFFHQSHIDGYFLNGIVEAWRGSRVKPVSEAHVAS
jgi:hypothetical protein